MHAPSRMTVNVNRPGKSLFIRFTLVYIYVSVYKITLII